MYVQLTSCVQEVKCHCIKSVRIWSYSVRMRENMVKNNSEYGHFLRTV